MSKTRTQTIKKYQGMLASIERVGTFDVRETTRNFKANVVVFTIMNQLGWLKRLSNHVYRYVGPTVTEQVSIDLCIKVIQYGRDHKTAQRNKNRFEKSIDKQNNVVKEIIQEINPIQQATIVEAPTTQLSPTDQMIQEAALLAEVGMRMGKKNLAAFIKAGLEVA